MKRAIAYLSISAAVFLIALFFMYIGFISPAKNGADSPFIRMTVCTLLCITVIGFSTRYIHLITGLAGLDSAHLNLGFTIAILLAIFTEYVSFGNSTLEPYYSALADRYKDGVGEYFYTYCKYVFMGGQVLIAVRTFIHSALLGLIKTIIKHCD